MENEEIEELKKLQQKLFEVVCREGVINICEETESVFGPAREYCEIIIKIVESMKNPFPFWVSNLKRSAEYILSELNTRRNEDDNKNSH